MVSSLYRLGKLSSIQCTVELKATTHGLSSSNDMMVPPAFTTTGLNISKDLARLECPPATGKFPKHKLVYVTTCTRCYRVTNMKSHETVVKYNSIKFIHLCS